MQFSEQLLSLLQAAAGIALQQKSEYFGITQIMLARLLSAEADVFCTDQVALNDDDLNVVSDHFEHAALAIAEELEKDSSEPIFEQQQIAKRFSLSVLPDLLLMNLFESWDEQQADTELDLDNFMQVVLHNWDQLYPVPLEKLGFIMPQEEADAEPFIDSMFSPDCDLSLRYGSAPMRALLPYTDYCRSIMEVLVRRYRQNALIYGPPGSGKSTVLRRLIEDTAAGRVPKIFQGRRFFELSHEIFLREVKDSRELAARFQILQEYLEQHTDIVMVVENIGFFISNESPILQEFIQRLFRLMSAKSLHFVLIADVEFYNRVYQANPSFVEILAALYIQPLQKEEVIQIIEDVKPHFESQYDFKVSKNHIRQLIDLADEHIKTMHFPKKALILLDVALSIIALDENHEPDWNAVLKIAIGRITGMRKQELATPGLNLEKLEAGLRKIIIGQDIAVSDVCRTIRFMKSDLDYNPQRPDGVFLFAGPAGVGKELFSAELSRLVYGNDPFVIDMSDFQEPESLQKIIGQQQATDAWQGTSILEQLEKDSRRVVVLKNIEYSCPEVLNYFLHGFEDGFLRAYTGRALSVSQMTVVLLSDLIAMDKEQGAYGFTDQEKADLKIERENLESYFTVDLLRSIDKLVIFQPLADEVLQRILCEKIVPQFKQKLSDLGHRFKLSAEVAELIAQQGENMQYNARNVDRKFEELVAEKVHEEIIAAKGGKLSISVIVQNEKIELETKRV
jgi:ATP-dependent Clp protease ATP-binding subunit ClpA